MLWIYTDEHRADMLGCMGKYPWLKTPNLDYLAREGVLFRNHHINAPQCTPSRVSAFTSLYPHQSGVLDISANFREQAWPQELVSFPECFERNGYRTANFGKVHAPEHRIFQESEEFEMFKEEAGYFSLGRGYDPEEHEIVMAKRGHIIGGRYPYVSGGRTPATYLTDEALHWLQARTVDEQPFFLSVSYNWPHTPVLAPEPFYSMYPRKLMPIKGWEEARSEKLTSYDDTFLKADINEEQLARVWATYAGCVSHLDDQFGRLIRELDRQGIRDNTIIVFTSDHGCLLGEHGLFQKGMFFKESTHVPFIISCPSRVPRGQVVHGLTEQVDLGPTLLELAGVTIPENFSGVPLLKDERSFKGKEAVFGELHLRDEQGVSRKTYRVSIRTERYMLNCNYLNQDESLSLPDQRDGVLCDILNDPEEKVNLYEAPVYAGIREQLENRIWEWLKR